MTGAIRRVGIIGLGDMGRLYARRFAACGYDVFAWDLPGKFESLKSELEPQGVLVAREGPKVLPLCDLVIFSVEAQNLAPAAAEFGPHLRTGAIVGGQTAVKCIEVEAFERFIPPGCPIVTCHSMHGPSVSPEGQILLLVKHRATEPEFAVARECFTHLGSVVHEVGSAEAHDRLTADIQAVTHLCYESMGTAWARRGVFPWKSPSYLSPIDYVKILMAQRIFAGKSHVYGELAILNPFAADYVAQYAQSVAELRGLMERGEGVRLRQRVHAAATEVFRDRPREPLIPAPLLEGVGREISATLTPGPNSHLSLLAMVDAWAEKGVNPYQNLVCRTPPYRLRLGIADHLFRDATLLERSLEAAVSDASIREDDAAFHAATLEWAEAIRAGDLARYHALFEEVRHFFGESLTEGVRLSDRLVQF